MRKYLCSSLQDCLVIFVTVIAVVVAATVAALAGGNLETASPASARASVFVLRCNFLFGDLGDNDAGVIWGLKEYRDADFCCICCGGC